LSRLKYKNPSEFKFDPIHLIDYIKSTSLCSRTWTNLYGLIKDYLKTIIAKSPPDKKAKLNQKISLSPGYLKIPSEVLVNLDHPY
jgi:hypothetical protein